MKRLLVFVPLLFATLSISQDIKVREEAVRLLEKADAVSAAVNLPNLERVDTFRAYSESGIKDGAFTRVVIQGTGRREETTFGDYHVVDIYTRDGVTTTRTQEVAPPEIKDLKWMTPINPLRFDDQDVIHKITNREVNGRPARCIEFDTIHGEKTDVNEICVDAANSTIVLEKLGNELLEYSEFSDFSGEMLPGKIRYSVSGTLKMEVSQTITRLDDATPDVLAAPPNSKYGAYCKTYRRPYGKSMPQPKPGNGGTQVDIIVRGLIGEDGRIHDPVVQSSERPDLNAEALDLIRQWVFSPGVCDGELNSIESAFTLHFQGR